MLAKKSGVIKTTGLACAMLASAFMYGHAWADQTVRITNGEWPPYLGRDLKYNGLASRIIAESFKLEGVTVIYGFFPWARALMLARQGTWDGTAVWLHNAERERDFYLSDPVIESRWVFFHLKSTVFDWRSIDDLKGLRIGATVAYDYGEAFQSAEAEKRIYVERVASEKLNFRKLIARRIDIFPADVKVGYSMAMATLKPEEVSMLTYHPLPVHAAQLHLLLSKKIKGNRELVSIFNRGLGAIRSNGSIDKYVSEACEE